MPSGASRREGVGIDARAVDARDDGVGIQPTLHDARLARRMRARAPSSTASIAAHRTRTTTPAPTRRRVARRAETTTARADETRARGRDGRRDGGMTRRAPSVARARRRGGGGLCGLGATSSRAISKDSVIFTFERGRADGARARRASGANETARTRLRARRASGANETDAPRSQVPRT